MLLTQLAGLDPAEWLVCSVANSSIRKVAIGCHKSRWKLANTMTAGEMACILLSRGAVAAYFIDGGGSAVHFSHIAHSIVHLPHVKCFWTGEGLVEDSNCRTKLAFMSLSKRAEN